MSGTRQGIVAGLLTFAVGILPTAGILWSASTGSIGTVSTPGFGGIAALVIGAIAVGSGALIAGAYRRAPNRRPGEVWSTWYGGFVCFVIGTWLVPFLVLLIFVDSDTALGDRLPEVMLVWTLLHLLFAVVALVLVRCLWRVKA